MKVVNKRKSLYTVYIGRGSVFGNAFRVGVDGTRDEVIAEYERHARNNSELLEHIKNLPEDAVLGCYCSP